MTTEKTRCVVFAYSEVGYRGLSVLLDSTMEVQLVVTHADSPAEPAWFRSVAELAGRHGIPTLHFESVPIGDLVEWVRNIRPHWIFSFYFRKILNPEILASATEGALNLHGSLLPRYRGRAPVNWAILAGERATGVTLHQMTPEPDQGDILGQQAVPILGNDIALDVLQKVAVAGEILLSRFLDELQRGALRYRKQDADQATYFGRRTAADGLIDWRKSAWEIHNLIRAVAPPFPGAYFDSPSGRLKLLRSFYTGVEAQRRMPRLYFQSGVFWADCADGRRFQIDDATLDDSTLDEALFADAFGAELAI